MKLIKPFLIIYFVFSFCIISHAETVILKSDEIVEGTIKERTEHDILIEKISPNIHYVRRIEYYKIKTIDGKKPDIPLGRGEVFLQDQSKYYRKIIEKYFQGNYKQVEDEFQKDLEWKRYNNSDLLILDLLSKFKSGKVKKEYVDKLFSGFSSYCSGKYEEALENLGKASEIMADDETAYVFQGIAYLGLGQIENATNNFKKAALVAPLCPEVYVLLGLAYLGQHSFVEANVNFEKAKEIFQRNKFDPGVDFAEKSIAISNQAFISFYYEKGLWEASLGNFNKARQDLEMIIKVDKLDYEALSSLEILVDLNKNTIKQDFAVLLFKGRLYLQNAKWTDAIKTLEQAIAIYPNYARACSSLGSAYLSNKQPEKAIAYYRKAIENNPNFYLPYYNLGVVYASRSEYKQAIEFYQKAANLNPDYAPTFSNLGVIYSELHNFQEAIKFYKKAIKIKPEFYSEPYYNLGNAYVNTRQEEAISYYKKSLEIEPLDPMAYEAIAVVYYNQGDMKNSIFYYEKAIEFDKDNSRLYHDLGTDYDRLNQPDQSEPYYKKAIQLNPEYADAYNELGTAQFRMTDYRQAKENLIKARELYKKQKQYDKVKDVEKLLDSNIFKRLL